MEKPEFFHHRIKDIFEMGFKKADLINFLAQEFQDIYHRGREELRAEFREIMGLPSHKDLQLLEDGIKIEYKDVERDFST